MTTLTGYPALAQEILAIREKRRREQEADAIVAEFLKSKGIETIEPKAAQPPKGGYKKASVKLPENDGDGAPRSYRGLGWKVLFAQEMRALGIFVEKYTALFQQEQEISAALARKETPRLLRQYNDVRKQEDALLADEDKRWDMTDRRLRDAVDRRAKRTANPVETSAAVFVRELRGALMVRSGR